jgi:hypothetical protein
MHPFIKTISKKLRETTIDFVSLYVKETYGPKASVCFIWSDDKDTTSFLMNRTEGRVVKHFSKISARKQCGENILLTHGLPMPDSKLPVVYLFVFPSVLESLGLERTIKMIRAWPGDSKVGDLPVVEYKVLGQR